MRRIRSFVLHGLIAAALLGIAATSGPARIAAQTPQGIVVRLGSTVTPQALDGRLMLFFSKDGASEPRSQVSATSLSSAQVFGIDVDALKPGEERAFDAAVLGYPIESLRDLPPGEYLLGVVTDGMPESFEHLVRFPPVSKIVQIDAIQIVG